MKIKFKMKLNENHFKKYSLETRQNLCKSLLERNTNKVPCVVSFERKDAIKYKLPSIEMRILVDADFSVGQLHIVLRRKIGLDSVDAMYLFVNNVLLPCSSVMRDVYAKHKSKCGFIFIDLRFLETYG